MQRTLAIVKPDAVAHGNIGEIVTRIEREGFRIVGMRRQYHIIEFHNELASSFAFLSSSYDNLERTKRKPGLGA